LKRVVYFLIVIVLVVVAYFSIFDYFKNGGIKILQDNTAQIKKTDETYLHYKIYNKKLLHKYKCDYRIVVVKKDSNYIIPKIKLRKGANSSVFVAILPNGEIKDVRISKNLNDIFDKKFISKIKSQKYNDTKNAVIKITEQFLDREIEFKK